jgi:hypothetical protein
MVWLYFGEQYLGTQIFQQPLILFSEGGFFQQAGEFPPQDTGMSLMLDGFAYGLAAWVASLGGAMMISFVYRFGTIAAT